MQKGPQNIASGGGLLFSALGLLAHITNTAKSVFEFQIPGVPTPTLLALIACVCAVWFAYINFDFVARKIRAREKRNAREWNMTVGEAIKHISEYSTSSYGMERSEALVYAIRDFIARAERGRIRVLGVPAGSTIPKIIKSREWVRNVIDPKSLIGQGNTTGGRLICANEEETLRYYSLRVDRYEIEREWPPRTTRHSWMAN